MSTHSFFADMASNAAPSYHSYANRQSRTDDKTGNDDFINLILKKQAQKTREPETRERREEQPQETRNNESARSNESDKAKFTSKHSALKSENPLFDSETGLDIVSLLAANKDIEEYMKGLSDTLGLDINGDLAFTLALNKQAALEAISQSAAENALTTDRLEQLSEVAKLLQALMLEAKAETGVDDTPKALMEKVLAKLKELSEKQDPLLSAVNITPEQITALQARLEKAGESSAKNNEGETLALQIMAGLIEISQSNGQIENAARNNLFIPAKSKGYSFDDMMADINARLNASASNNKPDIALNAGSINGSGTNSAKAEQATNAAATTSATQSNAGIFANWITTGGESALFGASDMDAILYEDQGAQLPAFNAQGNNAAALTSTVLHAKGATQAHPATQMVAATLQKMAGKNGDQSMRLLLDPPELGRVEVRMTIAKDKTMKATITAEKPETHLMLQRDSQVLERALQDSGLEAEGGISFELADSNHDFNQNGGHDSHNNGNGGGGDDGSEGEIIEEIESTMTWHVDPETGHMRYNILA